MKKIFLLLIVVFVILPLSALVPDEVSIGTGNDLFSCGLSRNDDDQLSFSLNADIAFGEKRIDIDYESITNRGWRKGWSVFDETSEAETDSEWSNGRYDELRIVGSHEFTFTKDNILLTVRPGIGIDICGNLGSQFLQNLAHDATGIHLVEIPYDIKTTTVRPVFSLDFSGLFEIKNFSIGPSSSITFVPTQRATEEVLLKASYYIIELSAGYRFSQCWSDSDPDYLSADELYSEYINGPVFNISIDGGFLKFDYSTAVLSRYGFGIIKTDIMALFDSENEESPVEYGAGLRGQQGWCFMVNDLYREISDTFDFVISSSYVSGQADDMKAEKVADLSTTLRDKWNNIFLQVGVRRNFKNEYVSPFASVLAGFYKTERTYLYTAITTDYKEVRSETLEVTYSPCAEVNMGLEISVVGNVSVDLLTGVSCVLNNGLNVYPYYGFAVRSK